MAVVLNNTVAENYSVEEIKISTVVMDLDEQALTIVYNLIDNLGKPRETKTIEVEGQNFVDSVVKANSIAGGDVYGAVKSSLYEQIKIADGYDGMEV